jgi:hypothetical protein
LDLLRQSEALGGGALRVDQGRAGDCGGRDGGFKNFIRQVDIGDRDVGVVAAKGLLINN